MPVVSWPDGSPDPLSHDPDRRPHPLAASWKTRRAFWADRAANEGALRANLLSLDTAADRIAQLVGDFMEER